MGKQLETGTQFPMRPTKVVLKAAANFSAPAGTAIGTASNQRVPPALDVSMINATSKGAAVTVSANNITLLPGIYEIEFAPQVAAVVGTAFSIGIANGGGGVVHAKFDAVNMLLNQLVSPVVKAVLHVQNVGDSNDTVTFRLASTNAGDALMLAGQFATITKIGNANES